MKRFLFVVLSILICVSSAGQTVAGEEKTWTGEWQYAFSPEGRKAWRPEFTLRFNYGLFATGAAFTGGVRVDSKRTLGLMVWQSEIWLDYVPAIVKTVSAGLYMRRYFHLGKRDIIALYSDLAVGAKYVYRASENDHYKKDDVLFTAVWQPGIRLRLLWNVHAFVGPMISTESLGLHFGIGF